MTLKKTLLEMTQNILSSMDSDEVNSISDSTESLQVAKVIQETYEFIVATADLPEHNSLFELIASGDINKPVQMSLPSNALSVEWLKYDCTDTGETAPTWKEVTWLEPKVFLDRMYMLNSDETAVDTATYADNSESFQILYWNDRFPTYYTSLDDRTLIFDAYKATVDSTLQKSKTMVYGELSADFTFDDTFTPDLDQKLFTLLQNEAKVQAFAELKQMDNAVAARRARKGWLNLQRQKQAVPDPNYWYNQLPNYARKTR